MQIEDIQNKRTLKVLLKSKIEDIQKENPKGLKSIEDFNNPEYQWRISK